MLSFCFNSAFTVFSFAFMLHSFCFDLLSFCVHLITNKKITNKPAGLQGGVIIVGWFIIAGGRSLKGYPLNIFFVFV